MENYKIACGYVRDRKPKPYIVVDLDFQNAVGYVDVTFEGDPSDCKLKIEADTVEAFEQPRKLGTLSDKEKRIICDYAFYVYMNWKMSRELMELKDYARNSDIYKEPEKLFDERAKEYNVAYRLTNGYKRLTFADYQKDNSLLDGCRIDERIEANELRERRARMNANEELEMHRFDERRKHKQGNEER